MCLSVCLTFYLSVCLCIYRSRSELIAESLEAVCIEIVKPNSKPFAVIACYRPPNNPSDFFDQLESVVDTLDSEDKEIILIGDLNCNILAISADNNTSKLNLLAELYQLDQLINEPTRVTDHSSTLLDVIFTNKPDRVTSSGVIHKGLSDHSLVFLTRKLSVPTNFKHKALRVRSYKNFNAQKFKGLRSTKIALGQPRYCTKIQTMRGMPGKSFFFQLLMFTHQ